MTDFMNSQLLARILLTAFCVVQGLATIALDLNRTHATHPWFHGPPDAERFYLAAVLALL